MSDRSKVTLGQFTPSTRFDATITIIFVNTNDLCKPIKAENWRKLNKISHCVSSIYFETLPQILGLAEKKRWVLQYPKWTDFEPIKAFSFCLKLINVSCPFYSKNYQSKWENCLIFTHKI